MPKKSQAFEHCKKKPYRGVTGGVYLEHILKKADEPGPVAETEFSAVIRRDGNDKVTEMDLVIERETFTYPLVRGGGSKGRPDIRSRVAFEALKGRVPDKAYNVFASKFKAGSEQKRDSDSAANERANDRANGIFVPPVRSRLCPYGKYDNALCIFNQLTGCSRQSFCGIAGISCLPCMLECCEYVYYDSDTRELVIIAVLSYA